MIIGILQARCSSSRLPGKVLMPILGVPMIWHQWQRLKQAKGLDKLVLATSVDVSDDFLAQYFIDRGELVFRGSLDNVLDRYYQCALKYGATQVVRLTGDCPLADPLLIDQLIEKHLAEGNDYTGVAETFPDGLDAEIFTFKALEKAHNNAITASHREHVTLYINQQPDVFKLASLASSHDLAYYRWTVDNSADFELVTKIYEKLYPINPRFGMHDILQLLTVYPEWMRINEHIVRNEGLAKSLAQDNLKMDIL